MVFPTSCHPSPHGFNPLQVDPDDFALFLDGLPSDARTQPWAVGVGEGFTGSVGGDVGVWLGLGWLHRLLLMSADAFIRDICCTCTGEQAFGLAFK